MNDERIKKLPKWARMEFARLEREVDRLERLVTDSDDREDWCRTGYYFDPLENRALIAGRANFMMRESDNDYIEVSGKETPHGRCLNVHYAGYGPGALTALTVRPGVANALSIWLDPQV